MFQSDRKFRRWDYRVSHDQALIRSPSSPDVATNIDVVFWGVEFLSVPSFFDGLRMHKGESHSDDALGYSPSDNGEVFVIHTGRRKFVIVAAGCKVLENELDIFESSLEGFAATDEGRDLGNVLAHS